MDRMNKVLNSQDSIFDASPLRTWTNDVEWKGIIFLYCTIIGFRLLSPEYKTGFLSIWVQNDLVLLASMNFETLWNIFFSGKEKIFIQWS